FLAPAGVPGQGGLLVGQRRLPLRGGRGGAPPQQLGGPRELVRQPQDAGGQQRLRPGALRRLVRPRQQGLAREGPRPRRPPGRATAPAVTRRSWSARMAPVLLTWRPTPAPRGARRSWYPKRLFSGGERRPGAWGVPSFSLPTGNAGRG